MQQVIISIANQKGGVGKSTLVALLYLKMKEQFSVCIIDTDPQQSLYSNLKKIEAINIPVFKSDMASLSNYLEENKDVLASYQVILVDTLPTTDINVIKLFQLSSHVFVPTGASVLDITATLNTIMVLKSIKKQYTLIFNNIKNTNDLNNLKSYLLNQDVNIAKNYLFSRVAYSRLLQNNFQIQDDKANSELDELIHELMTDKE